MSQGGAQRRLAAIVSADVAGYSRLMGHDEEGTLAALKSLRHDLVDPKIGSHGGRIVKTTGDGLLLEFASAVDAVRCALEMQTEIAAHNASIAEDRRIAFRIGINQGDIIVDDGDIFGDGVNVAARLQEIAPPGGLCLSDRVHDDARGRVDAAFLDLGEQRLKNIAQPVRVWGWNAGPLSPGASAGLPLPEKPSVAVLPFTNMSGDPEQEFFADGMCEDITSLLARLPQLFVSSRNSAFTYKGHAAAIPTIAAELGVRYVLQGSVRKAGNRIRVTAQLVEAATGGHVWSESYDRNVVDLFDLQDDIAQAIVGALLPRIVLAEAASATRKLPGNLDAWGYTVRALAIWWSDPTRHGLEEAIRLARAAIALDPGYALAHGLLAELLGTQSLSGWAESWLNTAKETSAVGQHALGLGADDASVLAHVAQGFLCLGRFVRAHELAERASELAPNNAHAAAIHAYSAAITGRHDQGVAHVERAFRLSPRDPRLHMFATVRAACEFFAGRYPEARTWAQRALQSKPQHFEPLAWITAANAAEGRLAEARTSLEKLRRLLPELSLATYKRPRTEGTRWQSFVDAMAAAGLE